MGMGLGYIPYSEIICYLDENKHRIVYRYERQEYIHWIQTIDHIYLNIQNEKDKKKKKSADGKTKHNDRS